MKKTMTLFTSLLVGTFGNTGFADSQKMIDIQTIQGRIDQTHAQWHTKSSWVTELPKSQVHRMLGLQRAPQGRLDFESMSVLNDTLPSVLDWRNKNGVNWLGPVMNQGNCGSCVAFSTVATLEAQASISSGMPWLHPEFSTQALFACGGGGCDSGWEPGAAADFLQTTGVPDEACMPYTEGSTGVDVSCSDQCGDASNRSQHIASYKTPTSGSGSVDSVKAALQNGPLETTLTVYDDFLAYGGGVYKHVTGEAAGGHAVSIVGYDNTKRAWLVRNSWGPEWGENGFVWVSWDDISGVGSETWSYTMPPSVGQLAVIYPGSLDYVSGTISITAKSNGLKAQHSQFQLRDTQGADISTLPCVAAADQSCTAQLDTTALKEGRYQISIETIGSPSLKSQIREFYVINSVPKMSLSFTPADGVDLSTPQSGRPEFNVTAHFSTVPIQHVEFRAIDQAGKVVSVKSNDYVLAQMKMGWRTISVPDGTYKILFHGETTYLGKVYAVDSNSYTITVKN